MTTQPRIFAVVPAAGVGRRMGSQIPKQYLTLAGCTVIEHTLQCLLNHPRIQSVVVALSATDTWWQNIACANNAKILLATGGIERCHSVLNALAILHDVTADDDWVLIHDAVRPCLSNEDLDKLFISLNEHPIGGLLGIPVRDTMKRTEITGTVINTVPRTNLWHAYTPQMFRFKLLHHALNLALQQGSIVTDETEAMELAGYKPIMVEGHINNLKITRPEDLILAEFFILNRLS